MGSAVIEYSGSDNVVERLNSTDRIEEELLLQVKSRLLAGGSLLLLSTAGPQTSLQFLHTLQVLSVGKLYNPDVRYSFNIPIEDKPQQFYWNSHGPWQACSKPCQGICSRVSAFVDLRILVVVGRGVFTYLSFFFFLKNSYVHTICKSFCLQTSSHIIYLDRPGYFGCQIELYKIQVMSDNTIFSLVKFEYICEAIQNQYCHFHFSSCGFTGHNLYYFCFLLSN